MEFKLYILFITALIPIIVGFIWYSKMAFGNAWMKSIGATEESLQGGNMILILGLCYVLGLLLSVMLMPLVIHQMSMFSVFANDTTLKDPNSESSLYLKHFYDTYGTRFRDFKHGAFHGALDSIFFALPIVGIPALLEKKGLKYVAIHVGYWMVTLAIMGGLVCQFM